VLAVMCLWVFSRMVRCSASCSVGMATNNVLHLFLVFLGDVSYLVDDVYHACAGGF